MYLTSSLIEIFSFKVDWLGSNQTWPDNERWFKLKILHENILLVNKLWRSNINVHVYHKLADLNLCIPKIFFSDW